MTTKDLSPTWLAESRQTIINTILEAVDKLASSKKPSLLILWGGRGAGKTLLLKSIEESIKALGSNIAAKRWDLKQSPLDDIRSGISKCVNAAESNQPLAVLLDNFDLLLRNDPDGSDFFEVERDVILPEVEKGGCLFIVTSQIELTQWREDEVRLSQQSFQIPALSRQELKTLIQDTELDPKHVYEMTYGHPKAIEWLQEQPALSDEAISKRAFDYFLNGLAPDIQQLADQVCLMPFFNPFLLRSIANQGNSGAGSLYLKHLDQIRELIGVGLVYWDVSVGAYRFRDNAVRCLLVRGVQLRDPQLFQNVNEIANEYYQAEARSANYLHRHLVSAVYHLANTLEDDHDVGAACLGWVCENLTNWIGAQWGEVLEMWVSGAHDLALAEEMKDLIGLEAFKKISDCLKTVQQSSS